MDQALISPARRVLSARSATRPLRKWKRLVQVRGCSPAGALGELRPVYHHRDAAKEAERRLRRTMFTFSDWQKHRSGARYLHHIATLLESGVARAVVRPVMYVTSLALSIACYCAAYAAKASWLPGWAPGPPTIAIEPIQLTSIALSLLLVFRTNASYARWDEARRKFGAITTTSRDIARQAFSWFPTSDIQGKAATARWLVALCRSSMCHLRGDEHDLRTELKDVLPKRELDWLHSSVHRPNFCLQMLTRIMAGTRMDSELLIRMDENMSKLVEAVSGCERIINTPIPLSYTRHTARFLMAWLACVPFALWSYCGWAMVPLTALISFVLLGIEEIGVYIEEPFSVMSLERLCDKLDMMMSSMMREHREIDEYFQQMAGTASEPPADGTTPAPPRAQASPTTHAHAPPTYTAQAPISPPQIQPSTQSEPGFHLGLMPHEVVVPA